MGWLSKLGSTPEYTHTITVAYQIPNQSWQENFRTLSQICQAIGEKLLTFSQDGSIGEYHFNNPEENDNSEVSIDIRPTGTCVEVILGALEQAVNEKLRNSDDYDKDALRISIKQIQPNTQRGSGPGR